MSWTEPSWSVAPSLRQCLLALWSRAGGRNLGGEGGREAADERKRAVQVSEWFQICDGSVSPKHVKTVQDSLKGCLKDKPFFFFFFPSDQRLFRCRKTCCNPAGSRLTVFHTGELAVTRSIAVRHEPVWKSGTLFFFLTADI